VGTLRDLDVLAEDILAAAAENAPREAGFAVLSEAVARRREAARAEVRQTLAGPEVAAFVLDLAGFVATRGWRAGGADPAALGASVRRHARRALDKRWKAVKKRTEKLDELSMEERHELRKEIKRLRYVVEIFDSLYPAGKAKRFRAALNRLQHDFGKLNDAAMVETMLTGPRAPGAGDLDAQRASGRVIGAALAEAAHLWPRVADDWRSLAERGPFWL
jgi:CHAD domain-containing protein